MSKADDKTIAGLKLPKSVRQHPTIKTLLARPGGRELFEEALIDAAVSAADKVLAALDDARPLNGAHDVEPAKKAPAKNRRASTTRKPRIKASAAPKDDVDEEAPQAVLIIDDADQLETLDPLDKSQPGAAD